LLLRFPADSEEERDLVIKVVNIGHYLDLGPSLPLKHLSDVESSGQVRYSPPRAPSKVWEHAFDFLADWVQHIPRARQHQVTYAGYFANALGNLNPRQGEPVLPEAPEKPGPRTLPDPGPGHRRPPSFHLELANDSFSDRDSRSPKDGDEWEAA